ncbi:speckle-type poz protein a-like isoform x2 [Gigaspora margarita]|uniref:Speckle-type poz protein a-like isoform x2 n=1 Tax=Gigaspora margarita TaxID=4874 RepID=A0A8H4EUW5_GIGMA|nr:speckle-type poz protein a-like isoform x2 [Gigaspora margarita]
MEIERENVNSATHERENVNSVTYEFEFEGLAQLNKSLYSPVFSSGSSGNSINEQHFWQLWIQPAENLKDNEEYLSLYLCAIPNATEIKSVEPWRERLNTTAVVYLQDPKTKNRIGSTIYYTNRNLKKFSIRCSYRGREFFVKRSAIPQTKLALGIEFLSVPFTETYVVWNDNKCVPPDSLVQSWKTAINNPRMADVLFNVQGEALCANKDIICGRSEYFKTMFTSGCVESRMISLTECGRLKKRHRDSSENCCKSVKKVIENRGQNTDNFHDTKNVEIKEKKDTRVPKKQRSHSEIGSSNFGNSSINHEIGLFSSGIQTTINDNNSTKTITLQHKNDHEIPETTANVIDKNKEVIINKRISSSERGTSSRNNSRINSPEAEVDDNEFYQEFPPGYYHVVNITDCDPQTFSALLHYLYTNEIEFSEPVGTTKITSLVHLFRLADKYQITDLRQRTLARIYKELAISNVAEVLFSLGHQWMDLKRVCMDYILKHFTAIRDTEGFNRVFEHPENYSGFSEITRDLFKRLKTSEDKEL